MTRFNPLRFLVIVLVLIGAAIYVQEQRLSTTSWTKPLEVVIFPINADGSPATARYLRTLTETHFESVGNFLSREAQRYDLSLDEPFRITLGPTLAQLPPDPPRPDDPIYRQLSWSMLFKVWAWHYTPDEASNFRRIRVFVVYHGSGQDASLPHSIGIQKGLLGLVHAFADKDMKTRNDIVIAHEILHTVGASDKYTGDGRPAIPAGLANPRKAPLFPQTRAEIMAGSIAVSEVESVSPASLRQCVVGPATAREIGWTLPD